MGAIISRANQPASGHNIGEGAESPLRLRRRNRWRALLGPRRRLAVFIKAHGDGSRTDGIVSVAMCAAEPDEWDDVQPRWEEATRRLGYPVRLSDFLAHERDETV